ncbi:hypothetical protein HC028_12900 [Planosporangium flavigriseum]|nr:hypothetical protein [Planosporangium flavigriseum]NJC65396.1 hypothetical protein [Planosporangium flavigriseum]
MTTMLYHPETLRILVNQRHQELIAEAAERRRFGRSRTGRHRRGCG